MLSKLVEPIKRMADILYDIGLTVTTTRTEPKKRTINNPFVIFCFTTLFLVQKSLAFFTDDEHTLLVKCGDVAHYYDHGQGRLGVIKIVINNWFCLVSILILTSQSIYYYNHKRGFTPTFNKVFQMIDGDIEPDEVGLSDKAQVAQLRKMSKLLLLVIKNNFQSLLPIAVIYNFATLFTTDYSTTAIIFCGIAPTIASYLLGILVNTIIYKQLMLFYILCQYFNLKVKNLKDSIIDMNSGMRFVMITKILRSFNTLYEEINEYNNTYWSKFLFSVWFTFGNAMTTFTSTMLIMDMGRTGLLCPGLCQLVQFGSVRHCVADRGFGQL